MANKIDRVPVREQDPKVRAHNFDEVALGYTEEQAIDEANRCLNCKNMPCVDGCPVKIHIPEFISKIKEGDFEGAYQIISKSSSLPAVCGRVCPQETQCESKCVRGIKGEPVGIGRVERFVADYAREHGFSAGEKPETNGHANFRAAVELIMNGIKPNVYAVYRNSIPSFVCFVNIFLQIILTFSKKYYTYKKWYFLLLFLYKAFFMCYNFFVFLYFMG